MGILAAVYSPDELDSNSRTNPLSGFESVTFAPGTTAPVESVTLPTIVAVSCAEAALVRQINKTKRARIFPAPMIGGLQPLAAIKFRTDPPMSYPPQKVPILWTPPLPTHLFFPGFPTQVSAN